MSRVMAYCCWIILATFCFSFLCFAQEQPQTSQQMSTEELAAALVAAKTIDERSVLLTKNREMVTVDLRKAIFAQGDRLRIKGNFSQAMEVFRLMKEVAEQIDDKIGIA